MMMLDDDDDDDDDDDVAVRTIRVRCELWRHFDKTATLAARLTGL
jgi:hypothetical protein